MVVKADGRRAFSPTQNTSHTFTPSLTSCRSMSALAWALKQWYACECCVSSVVWCADGGSVCVRPNLPACPFPMLPSLLSTFKRPLFSSPTVLWSAGKRVRPAAAADQDIRVEFGSYVRDEGRVELGSYVRGGARRARGSRRGETETERVTAFDWSTTFRPLLPAFSGLEDYRYRKDNEGKRRHAANK